MIYVLGGGAPLNYKVVGGTSAPSSPSENTIWVNTSTAITSHVFSATQPTGSAGMVWISTGTASQAQFNALKKNNITVYPLSAKQYVSGKWVNKTAKSYQGGKWVDWIPHLYSAGNKNTGFVAKAWAFVSGAEAYAPTIKYNSNNVVFTATGGGGSSSGVVYFPQKYDVTNLSKVVAKATLAGSVNPDVHPEGLYLWSSIGSGYYSVNYKACSLFNGLGTKTLSIDLSGLSGEYYIGFGLRIQNGQTITLTEAYFE